MSIDLITLEVLRNRFDAIANNMVSTLVRCAYSTIIKEGGDCSVALFNVNGDTVAQGLALPVHLGSMPPAVKNMLKAFPAKALKEGDVVIMNDPYNGGQHNPDVIGIVPIVYQGETIALAVSLAHHQDVGGRTPGSNPTDAMDVFEEGLCIPPVKYIDTGKPCEIVEAFIRQNVRYPDLAFGDLAAQVACGRTAAREFVELTNRYGKDVVLEAMDELLTRAEVQTRALVARIPDGTYSFTDWLDNDGIDLDRMISLKATVTVKGSDLTVDFTGTSPQVRGPFNAVPACALSAVRYVVRVITDPDIPNNEGCYRMIKLVLPPRSLLNPTRPAPVNCRAVTLRRVVDTTLGALAQAMPGKIPAANNGHPLVAHFGGFDRKGKPFIVSEMGTGGMGARPTKDGIDCIFTDASNATNIPAEVCETTAPLRINYFRIRRDSGGAGEFRGGCGFEKEYECLVDNITLAHRGERHYSQPWGLLGGKSGASSRTVVTRRNGKTEVIPSKGTIHLNKGDRIVLWTSGSGGYGDPLRRPAEKVSDDVLDQKISAAEARSLYGVVIEGGRLNVAATDALRARMGKQAKRVTVSTARTPAKRKVAVRSRAKPRRAVRG